MATPTMRYVTPVTPEEDLAFAPEPVVIYDLPDAGEAEPVAFGDLTGVPAALTSAQAAGTASIRAIGTTATTAAAGNHTHTFTALAGTVAGATGANLQAILNDIVTRLTAVEETP